MDWIAVIEILLPMLLKLLEDSPEEQALANMRNPGWYTRIRIKAQLRSHLDDMTDAVIMQMSKLSDDDLRGLIQVAKANAAGAPPV